MRRMRRFVPLLASLAFVPLAGCCSFARFFCGPDRTPWISVDFTTPEHAVRTLLEALRRDDPDVVYLCLSEGYKQRLGVDLAVAQLAWPRLREQNPGLYVAGYATVPDARYDGPDQARVEVDVEGRRLAVALVRQARWEVRLRRPDGTLSEQGENLESFAGALTIDPLDDDLYERSRLSLAPLSVLHPGLDELAPSSIEAAGLTRSWKIADLRVLAP